MSFFSGSPSFAEDVYGSLLIERLHGVSLDWSGSEFGVSPSGF
jgi:hypothetical protein